MSQTRRLLYLLQINAAMISGLVICGFIAHSLGLLAAGGDFVADTLAIALGIFAIHVRDKHGNKKAPGYVALLNAGLLLVVTVMVFIEAIRRLVHGSPEIHGLPVLIVAVVSAVAMLCGAVILGRNAGNEDLHMRSVLLDTLSDGLSAFTVAVVGGIIYITHNLYWLDALAAIGISLIIAFGAIKLLIDVYKALQSGDALATYDKKF